MIRTYLLASALLLGGATLAAAGPTGEFDDASLLDVIKGFYANEPFIRVMPNLPATKQVAGTNFCDIAVRSVRGRVVVISAIDNLVKGASGAAVGSLASP